MRTSNKLKKVCQNRECSLLFIHGEWRFFFPDKELGETVFTGKTFSKTIADAFSFLNKKEKKK
jgi:hypothetical protein